VAKRTDLPVVKGPVVIPLDEKILEFSNRWRRTAMERAKEVALEPNLRIQVVTAQDFIGTKLEAFRGRGRGDHANSHDDEDLQAVIDGREAIVGEIAAENADLRSYIAEQFRVLLKTAAFHDALSGYLLPDPGSQARLPVLLERIKGIADDRP